MRTRARAERGSGALEYLGILLLVAAVVGAVATLLAPQGQPTMQRAWCLVTGQGQCPAAPAAAPDRPVTPALPAGPWYADDTLTPEQRATRGRYVGLGDSYSSGEGGSEYEPGTDEDNQWRKWWDQHGLWPGEVRQNMCHRSTQAYSQQVSGRFSFQGFTFGACSGAVIEDFYSPNDEVHNVDRPNRQNEGEAPQLDALTPDTSLVTFSIGGNDIGFAAVLTECVKATAISFYDGISGAPPTSCSGSDVARDAEGRIPLTQARLTQLLQDARTRAPQARIVVVGYPRFFPGDPGSATSMIQAADQRWINDKVGELNDALARSVQDAGGASAGFEFVDPRDAFEGCEIGTASSCMNGLDVGFGGSFDSGRPVSNGSFHPNDEGHRRIAELIARQIRDGG